MQRTCGVCVRRFRFLGGVGDCPIPPEGREPFEEGERDCRYFKLGDRREKRPASEAGPTLF